MYAFSNRGSRRKGCGETNGICSTYARKQHGLINIPTLSILLGFSFTQIVRGFFIKLFKHLAEEGDGVLAFQQKQLTDFDVIMFMYI